MCPFFSALTSACMCARMRTAGQKEEAEAHTGMPPAVMVAGPEEPGTEAADGPDTFLIRINLGD